MNGRPMYWIDNGTAAVAGWMLVTSLRTAGQLASHDGQSVYLDCDGQPAAKPSHIVLRSKRGGFYVKKVTR